MSKTIQIAVVGSGYVGLVAAVCFAEIGHAVVCVDNDERKVAALQSGDTLIHENHLPELLERYRNTRVRFTTDLAEATRGCDAIFIAVGTPQSETGDADLSYVEAVACEIARSLTSYKVIVEKSPSRSTPTSGSAAPSSATASPAASSTSSPTPSSCAKAPPSQDFLHPDRIVVGADSEAAASLLGRHLRAAHLRRLLRAAGRHPRHLLRRSHLRRCCTPPPSRRRSSSTPPTPSWPSKSPSSTPSPTSARPPTPTSSRSPAASAWTAASARASSVPASATAAPASPRTSPPSAPSPSSSASTSACSPRSRRSTPQQKKRFLAKVRSALWTLRGKRLGVLGLAFKGETDDIRESPAIDLVEMLLAEGCSIAAYDPAAIERAQAGTSRQPATPLRRRRLRRRPRRRRPADPHRLGRVRRPRPQAPLHRHALPHRRRRPQPLRPQNRCSEHGFTYISIGRPAVYPARDVELATPAAA